MTRPTLRMIFRKRRSDYINASHLVVAGNALIPIAWMIKCGTLSWYAERGLSVSRELREHLTDSGLPQTSLIHRPPPPTSHSHARENICAHRRATRLLHADITRAPVNDGISWRMRRRNTSRSRVSDGITDDDRCHRHQRCGEMLGKYLLRLREVWHQARILQFVMCWFSSNAILRSNALTKS